jgi:alpha-1,2-mannosyltransferase
MPGEAWQSLNEYGDYCLLKNKERVRKKEHQVLKSRKV